MNKQYLISFLATLRGEKATSQGLARLEQKTDRVTKTTRKSSKATETLGQTMGILAKRALLVIPVWLLLRSAFMGVIRTITSMVSGYLDLEDGLARIQTVVHGTAQVVASQMNMIKNQIKDVATKTRVPLKELTETFYYLKTASLTTAEAMGAFEHTVDAMTGTGIKGKEMARAVAGVYNTMGRYILEGASASEKMKKIADILTYTYATQDVQMDELIQGYTKLAPFTAGLSDSFSDLVTMIGWLNTKMLRAGRTGRLTARAFLQITKNADKLAKTFGVTFDPDEPLNFMRIMGDINKVIKTQGKITSEQTEALRRVFATRALTPVQLIIKDYDDLVEAQKLANEEAENFAKRMAELKMGTLRGQMERMSNVTKILFEDFVSATQGTGDYAEALKKLADQIESMRPGVTSFGYLIGWIGYNINQLAIQYEALWKSFTKQPQWYEFIPGVGTIKLWKDYRKMEMEMGRKYKTMAQWTRDMVEDEKKLFAGKEKDDKEREEMQIQMEKNRENELADEKLIAEELKHKITLMKILGATAREIAKFRLESLEIEQMSEAERRVQQQVRLNALIREEVKAKEEVRNVMQNLYVDYMKATQAQDKEAKEGVRSLMEALTFKPETMVIWWRTATDEWRDMILENFDLLSKEQQEALKEYWEATRQFPDVEIFSPVTRLKKQIGEDIPNTFWENWIEKMTLATDKFRERFLGIVEETTVGGKMTRPVSAEENKEMVERINRQVEEYRKLVEEGTIPGGRIGETWVKPEITIERIEVTAEGVTPEELADAIKEKVKERLESDETIRKIRPKL